LRRADIDASQATSTTDHWAARLAERRHGSDRGFLRQTLEFLGPIRDRVIANADVSTGARALDVGCGEGFIAFASE
jgi:arsenite methyltransferase